MRRPLLLLLCSAPACVAYFDIQLLSEIAKYKVDKDAELRTVRLGRRRLEQSRRQLDESSTTEQASESVSGGTFWDRLSEEGKSPGKRAAITTIIAVAVVIVVCLCCWCAPICDIACWGRARDDNALRETCARTAHAERS